MADENDATAALEMRLRLTMHLGHQRASGVDGEKVARFRLLQHRLGDAMGGEDDRMRTRGRLAEVLDEDDALGLERVDDGSVVHDLVAHIDRGAVDFERPLDDVDRPHHAGAKAARGAKDHAKGRIVRRSGHCTGLRTRRANVFARAGAGSQARR